MSPLMASFTKHGFMHSFLAAASGNAYILGINCEMHCLPMLLVFIAFTHVPHEL